MAKDKIGTNAGQWYAEIGRLESGKQQRFYLGRTGEVSEDEARVRRHRVRQFWQRYSQYNRLNGYPLADGPIVDRSGNVVAASPSRTYWTDTAIDFAKQIGKGASRVVFDYGGRSVNELVDALADLNGHYDGVVLFVPRDDLRDRVKAVGDQHHVTVSAVAKAMQEPEPADDGQTVYRWLGKFANYAKQTKQAFDADAGKNDTTEWGHNFARQVEFLKSYMKDTPLIRLDYNAIEAVVITVANRPISKKTGKPLSVKYASSLLKVWKSFIRWLPKQTDWKKPDDWDEAFSHRPKKNNVEKAAKAIGKVKAYTVEQLQTLYHYATPFERCLLLLSLNCGFGAIEINGLVNRDCHIDTKVGYIKRVRLKHEEGVYGEHWLFPETVEAISWAQCRTSGILKRALKPEDRVILGGNGEPLVKLTGKGNRSNRIASAWNKLTTRVRQDHPDFPSLSFGKMRKTAGNLIKSFSDGETVAVFHQRSSAVASDDEAEVYTDRDYQKVFAAQHRVYEMLKPMFDGVIQPFTRPHQRTAVGLRAVDRIKQLWELGEPVAAIVAKTKASRATVYRYRPVPSVHPDQQKQEISHV